MVTTPRAGNPIFLLAPRCTGTFRFMTPERHVTIYLDDALRDSAEAGRHNFISQVVAALRHAGYSAGFAQNSSAERMKSADRPGYALFHMENPFHPRALSFRRAYFYPFWTIERSAERWNFRAARTRFDPEKVDSRRAAQFVERMREKHFPATGQIERQNLVLVPLQGLLTRHRSFQSCSPIQMLETTLQRYRDDEVVATLHPNEAYSAKERQALDDLGQRHANLTVQSGGSAAALAKCRLVATQNSSVAFTGLLFGKPAVLFARIDFHHIAANVGDLGADAAFLKAEKMTPEFERYVFWFLQKMAINAGRPAAEAKILAALRAGGWPV